MAGLIRWDPFQEMMDMRQRMNRMFEDFAPMQGRESMGEWPQGMAQNLPLDVSEDEESYTVRASIPGINPEDVEITLNNNMLTISGETRAESESEKGQYHVRERRFGRFSRTISLPANIDDGQIDASSENGVLTIRLPKKEESKPRRISIGNRTIEAGSDGGQTGRQSSNGGRQERRGSSGSQGRSGGNE